MIAADAKRSVKVAAVQTDPRLGAIDENVDGIERWIRRGADVGAELIVFPECAVNGYRYASAEEAMADAETVPGPTTERLAGIAADVGAVVAAGIVERDGTTLYNCAALIGPDGLIGKYRKTHIPFQAVDRFVAPGDIPLTVFDTAVGRIGMVICFDLRFPEPARVLALDGAQIIVNLTNLPPPGWPQPDFMFQTRAAENRVWLIAADRVGDERGASFIGRSCIVSPDGRKVAEAGDRSEELITAEIVPELADDKDLVIEPGVYEMHLVRARRPDLYGALTTGRSPQTPRPAR